MALPAQNRLKKESDFKKVLKAGRVYRGDHLFLKTLPNGGLPRFGISVSVKISTKAVVRNRIRRFLSETIRSRSLPKGAGYDTVVIVTKNGEPSVMQLDLVNTLTKAGLS